MKIPDVSTQNARQILSTLAKRGLSDEEIAVGIDVAGRTVVRWREGDAAPQPGRLKSLRRFAARVLKKATRKAA